MLTYAIFLGKEHFKYLLELCGIEIEYMANPAAATTAVNTPSMTLTMINRESGEYPPSDTESYSGEYVERTPTIVFHDECSDFIRNDIVNV